MPPRPTKKGKKAGKKKVVEDEISENLQDDDELLNMEANQLGNDQEDLTQEQKDETIYKKLTSNNPQAPINVTKFSYKERLFKTDDSVE
jgi:hypothetical protein